MASNERINVPVSNEVSKGYKVLYSLSVLLYAPLSVYSSGISSFLLSDIFLYIVTFILSLCIFGKKNKVVPAYIVFVPIAYIFFFSLLFALDDTSVLLRTARYIYYLLFVAVFGKSFFSVEISLSIYEKIAVFSTLFIIVQYVLYFGAGFYLPGYLPFLNVAREELVLYSFNIYTAVNQRMRSVFSEPAHYAAYVAFYMYLVLIRNGLSKIVLKDVFVCLFITLGIVLSASTTGVSLAALGWSFFFLFKCLNKRIDLKYGLFFPFIVAVILSVLQIDNVQNAIFRLTENSAQEGRLINTFEVDVSSFSISSLFGHGMDLQEMYLASFGRMLFYFGIVGTLIVVVSFFIYSIKNKFAFLVFLFMMVMGVGTALWVSGNIILYLSFLLAYSTYSQEANQNNISFYK